MLHYSQRIQKKSRLTEEQEQRSLELYQKYEVERKGKGQCDFRCLRGKERGEGHAGIRGGRVLNISTLSTSLSGPWGLANSGKGGTPGLHDGDSMARRLNFPTMMAGALLVFQRYVLSMGR